jgi:hypothetical protein
VEFRPYEELPARVCLAGRRWELEEVELEDLLSIVDRTEELVRTGRDPGAASLPPRSYSPECVEGLFSEVRLNRVPGSSQLECF